MSNNIAKEDGVVTEILDHGVEVQRKVFAGQPIPPNLVEAYEASGKPAKAKPGTKPKDASASE